MARFFGITPLPGETLATDGKGLRGSYETGGDHPEVASHPAIMLVSAYIVERGLILEPYEVAAKTNEITALPAFIQQMALKGVVFACDAISIQKNGADACGEPESLLGRTQGQSIRLTQGCASALSSQQTVQQVNKGHGRIEKRTVSISHLLDEMPDLPGLQTLIQVQSERQVHRATVVEVSTETRYYVASFTETAQAFADRIRGYWGVENKVHYVRDVTQGEDASRSRTPPLVQSWALARNFALNLYRDEGFDNMAQAQRLSGFGLGTLISLFRMK